MKKISCYRNLKAMIKKKRKFYRILFVLKNFIFSNKKYIYIYFSLIFIWLAYEEQWVGIFEKYIIPHLNIESNFIIKIIFTFLLISIIPFWIKCKKKEYKVSLFSISLLITSIIVYLIYRSLVGGSYEFISYIAFIGYLDIIFFIILIFVCLFIYNIIKGIIRLKEQSKNNTAISSDYIPDIPISSPSEDILDYKFEAKNIAESLYTLPSKPCSIGVISPWGTGKTSFLNLIKSYLDKNKIIIIEFNPRHSAKTENIQEDFFFELSAILKEYNSTFSLMFKEYMKTLNLIDQGFFQSIFNIYSITSKNEEKKNLNIELNKINKKIVVFIEDFDRLFKNEIIEVIKLIDGNASFCNIIFIAAYDKNYVNELIDRDGYTHFLDKFFTKEIYIPLRPYDKTLQFLIDQLNKTVNAHYNDQINALEESLDFITPIIQKNKNIIRKNLMSLRDIKRFINMFARPYKQVIEEVDFEDYFLLSMIKYKYPNEYESLYKGLYTTTVPNEYSSNIVLDKKIQENASINSLEILNILFPSENDKNHIRSINKSLVFDIYFHNSVYRAIKMSELKLLLNDDLTDVKLKLKKWEEEKRFTDVFEFLSSRNILAFDNKSQFINYLNVLFYIGLNYYNTIIYIYILRLLYSTNKSDICEKYEIVNEEYDNLLLDRLKTIDNCYSFQITKKIILNILKKELKDEIIFTHKDILEINEWMLDDYIEKEKNMNSLHLDLLYSCISGYDLNNRIPSLSPRSCLTIKKMISLQPDFYINNYVRLGGVSSSSDFNSISREPFYKQIFENDNNFEEFISNSDLNTIDKIKTVRNFWQLYKANNFKPIEYSDQGDVQLKINKNLTKELAQLIQLQIIENKITKIKKRTIQNTLSSMKRSLYILKCDQLGQQILEINLPINYSNKLFNELITLKTTLTLK